jgi:uncharacterized membrane protein SpoIIM required for sporulation
MAPLQLKSHRFRQEREWDWRKLDGLLNRVESRGARSLSDEELLAVPVLYRSALSSLSVARATSLDQGLIDYLESLCARAYFLVYGTRPRILKRIAGFFGRSWPKAVQLLWKETLASALILILSAVVGYLLVRQDPNWFYAMVDQGMSGGRDPTATAESLRKTLYDDVGKEGLSYFAASLFSHNAQVSLFAFALGFAFGLPTALLIATNGALLGAMMAVFIDKGLGFEFTGWLFIHGTTELFAVVLAGAAGFRIGLAVAFPGERTRLDSAAAAGRAAGAVMAGVVIMLLAAGVLEGLGRQLIRDDLIRYSIGGGMGLLWLCYYYLPRRGGLHESE